MKTGFKTRLKKSFSFLMLLVMLCSMIPFIHTTTVLAAPTYIGALGTYTENGNVFKFKSGTQEVTLELCDQRTVRVKLSVDGTYRGDDPLYYMVQKNEWPSVNKTVTDKGTYIEIKTDALEIRVTKSPLRIGMYDLDGNLISRDDDTQGMYWDGTLRGVRKVEGTQNAGGIFGFGTSDHGRSLSIGFNRYSTDITNFFSMAHGKLMAPFFMSTVGYGVFLNTIETNTKFFARGGGFETGGYLDYYFMYGPDFKTILNEYAEITGRMELYGKWAQGFMLSKYGNDNATQSEFLQWMNRLRNEDYPTDSYVFDYGWRQNGEKWGAFNWDTSGRYPNLAYMFSEAKRLGFHIGLHNNKGTPGANKGGLWEPEASKTWSDLHINNVIAPGYGDWFWPDEFDTTGGLPSGQTDTYGTKNYMPTFSSKGPYEAWKAYTIESRPMFVTRGSYAGQHFATAWSGDINNDVTELGQQITYHLNAGMLGYWATSHDLGGFMSKPSDELYTRWTAEFGAWNAVMRTHGHNGREPWLYNTVAQNTLRNNLKIRYALYPYSYSLAWQGYSQGTPIMRPMVLEDQSRKNSASWTLDRQYYYGDWFLVAPATSLSATTVSIWLPPNTTWYNYYTGARYEGGTSGKTISVGAALDDIPVFIKSGAIVPMGPAINYADEKPLNPLTLDIYPKGATSFELYEDDGISRRYLTENAYSTTKFDSLQNGSNISFTINARVDHNATVYKPVARSYNLKFNHIAVINGVTIDGTAISAKTTLADYNASSEGYWLDTSKNIVYVKTPDTGAKKVVVLNSGGIVEPELGDEVGTLPIPNVMDWSVFELENATLTGGSSNISVDTEWKGYSGNGFAKGFKTTSCAAECVVNVVSSGTYNFLLRANAGKKNDATDLTPRQGAIYVNGVKVSDFEVSVTNEWGNSSSKNGMWITYEVPGAYLTAGRNVITVKSEGSRNPGNYNLDSLTFIRKTKNAFAPIEAEAADGSNGCTIESDAKCSGGKKVTLSAGGWTKYAEVNGAAKCAITLRAKSATGGQIVVQENGIGDKVLKIIDLTGDGQWHTYAVPCENTEAIISDVFLELRGAGASCEIDWFEFDTTKPVVNPYDTISAPTATTRFRIDTTSKNFGGTVGTVSMCNHIETGDYLIFKDVDFGKFGPKSVAIRYAAGIVNKIGRVEFRIDSLGGKTIATVNTAKTSAGTTADWNTLAYSPEVLSTAVTGVHDLYLVFIDLIDAQSICDFASFVFTELDLSSSVSIQKAGSVINANFKIGNESPTENLNAICLFAEYDDGALISLKSSDATVGASSSQNQSLSIPATNNEIKAFLLDAETYIPLCAEASHVGSWFEENLALNKPARSTDFQSGYPFANAVDDDRTTRWSASAGGYPKWLEVDLGSECELQDLDLYWFVSGTRSYQYRVYGRTTPITDWSTPYATNKNFATDSNYTLLLDNSGNSTISHTTDDLSGKTARYIVISVVSSTGNAGNASLFSVEVSGTR